MGTEDVSLFIRTQQLSYVGTMITNAVVLLFKKQIWRITTKGVV